MAKSVNAKLPDRRLAGSLAFFGLQLVAAIYLVADGIDDLIAEAAQGFTLGIVMECLVALALLGGVVLGFLYIRRITRELSWRERSLANARGALADHIELRFREWGLTRSEGEVALFALKGCDVAEISRLRNAAPGTVRSQLSQVYSKAGVSSQAMLVSLFIDDLIDVASLRPGAAEPS